MPEPRAGLLGHTDHDFDSSTNERARLRAAVAERGRVVRGQFVTITDAVTPDLTFLGRLVAGPFFPDSGSIVADIEIHGELHGQRTRGTNNRPSPGSPVYEMPSTEVAGLIGVGGDMAIGALAGREDIPIRLRGDSKEVLPRNVGIFGTVGSGKSNSVQVLIEEAAAGGWAVVLLDLEGEYVDMDQPTDQESMVPLLERHERQPEGLGDFHTYHP